jgi:phage terminase large subunit GpA-like protein
MTTNNFYINGFIGGLKPDPRITVSEWADKYRILPSKGSAEPGRYRTARAPYLKEIMDNLSPTSPVKKIVFMKSSQVGGTEIGLNWLGFIFHMSPAPVMIIQPTIELAERFSKQRVQPMIDETHPLGEIIAPARSRDSGNSILIKEFTGGVLIISGSNSPSSLRSMPIKYLFADEVSAYEGNSEGDPLALAEKRAQTFARRKIFLNSTPHSKDTCRIENEFLKTDQRRYFVPCPECGEYQYLQFKNLKWEENNHRTAKYECEKCSALIPEHKKTKMLAKGEWRATAPSDDDSVVGYHINSLYSPLGWCSWADIVDEFLKAKSNPEKLRTWVNSILGETFEEEFSAKIGAEGLRGRVETWEPNKLPSGVRVLVAGVDVQDNRFEISIWGYGRGDESWLVNHQAIHGDPAQPEIWKSLDSILNREWDSMDGFRIPISAAGIDSGGHFTHEVYAYVREKRSHKVKIMAMKGQSQRGKPAIGKPSKMDINFRGQSLKAGVDLYPIGVDTIKTTLYGRLKISEHGEGFIHFNAVTTDDYFQQLTSEKQVTRYVRGFPVRDWVKQNGVRNEALDCAVYSFAAYQWVCTRFHRATMWEQIEKQLGLKGVPIKEEKKIEEVKQPEQNIDEPLKQQITQRRNTHIKRGGSFVKGY